MFNLQHGKAKVFFENLTPSQSEDDLESIVVTHLLPGRKTFIDGVNRRAPVKHIIPKPSSVALSEIQIMDTDYDVQQITRNSSAETLRRLVEEHSGKSKLVLMDVGGYFASAMEKIPDFKDKVLGVIEDTQNGEKKYARLNKPYPVPIVSVARSPLKTPEDTMVGKSIVFSVERVARRIEQLLHGKNCLVIGYGKVGRGIAIDLKHRNAHVQLYDNDAIQRVRADGHGYDVVHNLDQIENCDYVFCATGSGSLGSEEFKRVKDGCFISTATSSDEEFQDGALNGFSKLSMGRESGLFRYESANGKSFYLVNDGKAANFLDNAVVAEYIYLVQAEIIRAVDLLVEESSRNKEQKYIQMLNNDERRKIADLWESVFR